MAGAARNAASCSPAACRDCSGIREFPVEAVAGHLLFVGIQTSSGLGTMSQLQAWVTYRTRPHAAIHDIAGRISSLHVGGMDLSRDNRRGCSQAITLAVA